MTPNADGLAEPPGPLAAVSGDGLVFGPWSDTDPVQRLASALRGHARAACGDSWGSPGHGFPFATAVSALWSRFHKFDAADPAWPDRDRIVFADSRGAALHSAALELTGHAAGSGAEPPHAADVALGAMGQGLGHAVGLALAERLLAARFGRSLVDHRTWVFAAGGEVLGGLCHEAASLAGRLRLGRLTVLWDEPDEDEAGPGAGDDALRRFGAYGWNARRVDGGNSAEMVTALTMAARSAKPSLIACRSTPSGAALGNQAEAVTAEAMAAWEALGTRGSAPRRAWLKRLARHALRTEFERVMAARLPESVQEALSGLRASFAASRPAMATRAASQRVLEAIAPRLPELVGGPADLAMAFAGPVAGRAVAAASRQPHRVAPWAVREHGMAAAMNGLALHGGLIPYGGTLVVFTDYLRPALRMAALLRRRVIHLLTRDGGDRAEDGGEDGPGHQPVEHLASLRAVPNLFVFRPADAIETAECWELALARGDGPSLLALSRQPVSSLRPPGRSGENRAARGGYVLAEAEGGRQATLIATGPEVATALSARELLRNEGTQVAVVSLPCWELFERLTEAERQAVLGSVPRIGIEAAGGFGWERWLGPDGVFVGFDRHGGETRGPHWPAHPRPTAADVLGAVRQCLGQG